MRGKLFVLIVAAALAQAAPASAGLLPGAICDAEGTTGCQATVGDVTVSVDHCRTEDRSVYEFPYEYHDFTTNCTTGVNELGYECTHTAYGSSRSGTYDEHRCAMEYSEGGVTAAQSCHDVEDYYHEDHPHSDGCSAGVAGPASVSCTFDPYVNAWRTYSTTEVVDAEPDAPSCDTPGGM